MIVVIRKYHYACVRPRATGFLSVIVHFADDRGWSRVAPQTMAVIVTAFCTRVPDLPSMVKV